MNQDRQNRQGWSRKIEKLIDATDQLGHAESHTSEYPELSRKIREVRKRIEKEIISDGDGTPHCIACASKHMGHAEVSLEEALATGEKVPVTPTEIRKLRREMLEKYGDIGCETCETALEPIGSIETNEGKTTIFQQRPIMTKIDERPIGKLRPKLLDTARKLVRGGDVW